jgi:hypothetical protein
MFNVNIKDNPTISSIALKIFRCNLMAKENINITPYEIYSDIRSGYTGGHVDVYKAYGEKLFYYDVNSLYPFVMANNPFSVGNCEFVTAHDNRKLELNDTFGIIFANITAPDNLDVPILLTKFNNKSLAPLGC